METRTLIMAAFLRGFKAGEEFAYKKEGPYLLGSSREKEIAIFLEQTVRNLLPEKVLEEPKENIVPVTIVASAEPPAHKPELWTKLCDEGIKLMALQANGEYAEVKPVP